MKYSSGENIPINQTIISSERQEFDCVIPRIVTNWSKFMVKLSFHWISISTHKYCIVNFSKNFGEQHVLVLFITEAFWDIFYFLFLIPIKLLLSFLENFNQMQYGTDSKFYRLWNLSYSLTFYRYKQHAAEVNSLNAVMRLICLGIISSICWLDLINPYNTYFHFQNHSDHSWPT